MRTEPSSTAGESRVCPHCKATILKSAVSCPVCHHTLKFGASGSGPRSVLTLCPLSLEATITHPGKGSAVEYSVLLEIQDETGNVISRQVMGVGVLRQAEKRRFSVRVEVGSDTSIT